MSNRRAHVWHLAPPSPPCFADRLIWLEFLASAAEEPAVGQFQVLLIEKGKPVRFNLRYPFCDACTAQHKAAMQAANKCRPAWLTDMLPKEPSHAA
jgi:hypothetical protein